MWHLCFIVSAVGGMVCLKTFLIVENFSSESFPGPKTGLKLSEDKKKNLAKILKLERSIDWNITQRSCSFNENKANFALNSEPERLLDAGAENNSEQGDNDSVSSRESGCVPSWVIYSENSSMGSLGLFVSFIISKSSEKLAALINLPLFALFCRGCLICPSFAALWTVCHVHVSQFTRYNATPCIRSVKVELNIL